MIYATQAATKRPLDSEKLVGFSFISLTIPNKRVGNQFSPCCEGRHEPGVEFSETFYGGSAQLALPSSPSTGSPPSAVRLHLHGVKLKGLGQSLQSAGPRKQWTNTGRDGYPGAEESSSGQDPQRS